MTKSAKAVNGKHDEKVESCRNNYEVEDCINEGGPIEGDAVNDKSSTMNSSTCYNLDERLNKGFGKLGHDSGKCGADNHSDREINYIAAKYKFLKSFKHEISLEAVWYEPHPNGAE